MKTLNKALLLVTLLVISVQAYDYATEAAKKTTCDTTLVTTIDACKSNTDCNNEINSFTSCKSSNASATSVTTQFEAG